MRRLDARGPATSRRSRARQANSIAPSSTILRRRPCACANGWRRENGSSSTMPKRQRQTLWWSSVAEDGAAAILAGPRDAAVKENCSIQREETCLRSQLSETDGGSYSAQRWG